MQNKVMLRFAVAIAAFVAFTPITTPAEARVQLKLCERLASAYCAGSYSTDAEIAECYYAKVVEYCGIDPQYPITW